MRVARGRDLKVDDSPAVLLSLKLRHPAVAKGIVLGAVATFLVNLGGCGFFLWQLSKIG